MANDRHRKPMRGLVLRASAITLKDIESVQVLFEILNGNRRLKREQRCFMATTKAQTKRADRDALTIDSVLLLS